ncbi:hypothetical protein AQJ11_20165 [Streptomyces corchorusii]|uniref:Uncharacterized protein n=1 Tax=Streptomyces corchorusii TaxID=1903 RepID=A0A117QFN0_STRCK|nr:hypothetical protein AQJ11_20165 [Streptomyces corchorusii]
MPAASGGLSGRAAGREQGGEVGAVAVTGGPVRDVLARSRATAQDREVGMNGIVVFRAGGRAGPGRARPAGR